MMYVPSTNQCSHSYNVATTSFDPLQWNGYSWLFMVSITVKSLLRDSLHSPVFSMKLDWAVTVPVLILVLVTFTVVESWAAITLIISPSGFVFSGTVTTLDPLRVYWWDLLNQHVTGSSSYKNMVHSCLENTEIGLSALTWVPDMSDCIQSGKH